jgi:hypothetical protein
MDALVFGASGRMVRAAAGRPGLAGTIYRHRDSRPGCSVAAFRRCPADVGLTRLVSHGLTMICLRGASRTETGNMTLLSRQ